MTIPKKRLNAAFLVFPNPLGVVKGPQPLNFNPALTACTSKRMKTAGFRTLRVLPPGSAARGKTRKELAEATRGHFRERLEFPPAASVIHAAGGHMHSAGAMAASAGAGSAVVVAGYYPSGDKLIHQL